MSQEASGLKKERKKVLQGALKMASGTLTSRILGLLRDIALAGLFERGVTDAWAAAFRLPNFFRRIFGEGSLAVSFIPVFMQAQALDPSGGRARNLANAVYTLLLILLGLSTVIGFIYIEPLFRLFLSASYEQNSAQWELTVRLGRIMFGFIFFVCTYAYAAGILNALGSFGLPAVAPALLNVAMLAFTFMPPSWFSHYGDGLAWGVLVGGLLQFALVWFGLSAKNYLPRLSWNWKNTDVFLVFKNMGPGLFAMGVAQAGALVSLYFASSLGQGAISYIYWADRLLELPLSLVSVSLGTALLPELSALFAQGDSGKAKETFSESFLTNLFLALPAGCGLLLLAEPIVEALFLRGEFQTRDLEMTAAILKIYGVSLLFLASSRVMMPVFYAMKDTKTPAWMAFFCLGLQVWLAPLLMQRWGLQGLVMASAVAAIANCFVLAVGLRWKLKFSWGPLVRPILKIGVATAAMAGFLYLYRLGQFEIQQGLRLPVLVLVILVGSSLYFFVSWILKIPEASKIRRLFPL